MAIVEGNCDEGGNSQQQWQEKRAQMEAAREERVERR